MIYIGREKRRIAKVVLQRHKEDINEFTKIVDITSTNNNNNVDVKSRIHVHVNSE
jgi:hypothetical protein